jgi:hypothetical protein
MAQSPNQPSGDGGAEFVRKIVTDPSNVPDVMRLYGYPGASSEEDHERLYLSPDLTNYVEIPAKATLHRMAVPADQDPHGAVVLWVRSDAALIQKMSPAAQALAHYFAGAIQAASGGGVGWAGGMAAGPAAVAGLPPSPLDGCQPVSLPQALCGRTPVIPCVTQAQTPCGPCLTRAQTPCLPCLTHAQTPCLPCPTHIQTPCLPCLTQAQTPCLPCPTHAQTPCLPCLTQIASCPPICTHAVCSVGCTRVGPECPFPTEVTCIPACHQNTLQPPCHVTAAVVCVPPGSIACGGSVACAAPGGGPDVQQGVAPQAAFCVAGTVIATAACTLFACQSVRCPSAVCSYHTPCCPW